MYRPILDRINIPLAAKIVICTLIIVGVTIFCLTLFFPWLADYIPYPLGNAGYVDPNAG